MTVRILDLAPERNDGYDLTDYFLGGGTVDDLRAMITAEPEPRFRLLSAEEVESLPLPPWQVVGLLPQGCLAELHGPPGTGKSFVALDLALSVATGERFLSRRTERGTAVYVAGEGSAGLGARLRAWKAHHGVTEPVGVSFLTEPVQLLSEADVDAFLAVLPPEPALIVLDTLARCLVGGEENSAKDVGLAIAAADRIRRATGAAVLIVHHTRKDGDTERGSTALRGAVDAMWSLRERGSGLQLVSEKMKDAEAFEPIPLRLTPVEGSAVVTPNDGLERPSDDLTPNQRKALQSLQRDFLSDGATATEWRASSRIPDSSFYGARTDCVRRGYVTDPGGVRGGKYRLTDRGIAALTLNSNLTPNSLQESDSTHFLQNPPLRGVGGWSEASEGPLF
jgi:hypothetical protein